MTKIHRLRFLGLSLLMALYLVNTAHAEDQQLPSSTERAIATYNDSIAKAVAEYQSAVQNARNAALKVVEKDLEKAKKENKSDLEMLIVSQIDQINGISPQDGKADPANTPYGSWERLIESKSTGVSLGRLPKGTKITLQYVQGKWGWHENDTTPESPDAAQEGRRRLAVYGDGQSVEIVPTGTAKKPYTYVTMKEYSEIILRISSLEGNRPGTGQVLYKVKVSR